MCVKCRCKALILARKSVQPFIIHSHLYSFSFRLFCVCVCVCAHVCVPSLLRDRNSVRRIKRSPWWHGFVWWVMRWTFFIIIKEKNTSAKFCPLSPEGCSVYNTFYVLAAWMLRVCTHPHKCTFNVQKGAGSSTHYYHASELTFFYFFWKSHLS